MSPKRIRRSRVSGWRQPPGSIYVGRPTIWGNPFQLYPTTTRPTDAQRFALTLAYRAWLDRVLVHDATLDLWYLDDPGHHQYFPVERLRGRDLVCWCPLDQACHADVLLEIANQ